jgi:Ras-related protein Rab-40
LQHAPGVPKVLVGNRLHLAFKRQVGQREAEMYAAKNRMAFFEVSPLCNFNIRESFSELSRMALHRNGLERLWRSNKGNFSTFFFFFIRPLIKKNSLLNFGQS